MEGERDSKRQTETEREGQTDRHADRQTKREREREGGSVLTIFLFLNIPECLDSKTKTNTIPETQNNSHKLT